MTTQVATREQSNSITIYDAEHGLQKIAVAEAGERHFARAKDATQLLKAVETKLKAQAEYVVWRDGTVVPSQVRGGPGRGIKRMVRSSSVLPAADPGAQIAHKWRQRFCSDGTIDEEKLAKALNEARLRCIRICEQQNVGTIRGTEGTGEFERYTPTKYVAAVRKVLGQIDLDPASSRKAQKFVKAKKFLTAREDGLEHEWLGRIFLNPPYHRELMPAFIDKLLVEFGSGRTTAAILLTNNSTDTEWFSLVTPVCASVCFTIGRINFWTPDDEIVKPTQGQAFFYFGNKVARFEEVFQGGELGVCYRPSRR